MPTDIEQLSRLWDRFDYKAIVAFTGYKDRYDSLQVELQRIGMNRNVSTHWDFPTPYSQILLRNVPMTRYNSHHSCFNIGMNNYRAIATAYYLGCNNCLIMEDDVRFLKDTKLLEEIVTSIPQDYDLALLDNNKPCGMSPDIYFDIFKNPVAPHWFRFTNLRSTGCYSMSRRCMERYMKLFEAPAFGRSILCNPDGYFRVECLGHDANLYVANPAIALQKMYPTSHCSNRKMNEYYELHNKIDASPQKYNI